MPVTIGNLTEYVLYLSDPVNSSIGPSEKKKFEYLTYDAVISAPDIARLASINLIRIINLDAYVYDSAWFGPSRFKLGNYQLWIDSLGILRLKNGEATFDFDGSPIGNNVPHGATHVFEGTDPIPNIEVLESIWSCTATEQVLDLVFESSSNTVSRSNATSLATMPVIGMIINKPTATTCIIATSGEIPGIGGLTPDRAYYADIVNGGITLSIPATSGAVVQSVGTSKSNNVLSLHLDTYIVRA